MAPSRGAQISEREQFAPSKLLALNLTSAHARVYTNRRARAHTHTHSHTYTHAQRTHTHARAHKQHTIPQLEMLEKVREGRGHVSVAHVLIEE